MCSKTLRLWDRHAGSVVGEAGLGQTVGPSLTAKDDLLVVAPAGVLPVREVQPVGDGHRVRFVIGEGVSRAEGVVADRGLPRCELLSLHPLDGGGDRADIGWTVDRSVDEQRFFDPDVVEAELAPAVGEANAGIGGEFRSDDVGLVALDETDFE